MIKVDDVLKRRMRSTQISTLHSHAFDLPDNTVFEPPCSMKWMRVEHSLFLGAFSYAVNGYYFAVRIGRYVSIGEEVQIGRGSHPVRWASTSPAFYQKHEDLLDLTIRQASQHVINAPYIPPKETTIGNDVYIGHGAFLIQGISVGDGSVIGANSVVTKDVPPYAIVAGNPAKLKGMRFSDTLIDRMRGLEWWKYAFWDLSGAPVADPEAFLDFVERRMSEGIVPFKPKLVHLKSLVECD